MKKLLSALLLLPSLAFADTKISALTSTTSMNTSDIIPVVVTPGSTPANRIITFQNFYNSIPSTITAASLGALTTSSATATYLQQSSAAATYASISGSNNYIQNANSLQSGSTFYVSSGTISSPGTYPLTLNNTQSAPNSVGIRFQNGTQFIEVDNFNLLCSDLSSSCYSLPLDFTWTSREFAFNNDGRFFATPSGTTVNKFSSVIGGSLIVGGTSNPNYTDIQNIGDGNLFANHGIIASTAAITNTNTSVNAVVITSTGTGIPLKVIPQGLVSGGYQNRQGAVTIGDDIGTRPFSTELVLVDSTTDSQLGGGLMEIWEDNPNHNDPILWFHRVDQNSAPEIRMDGPSPNEEMVNTSTDNTKGLGKFEYAAIANQGVDLQVNSRAWDNSTFENLAYWHRLSANDSPSGLVLQSQSLADDSGVLAASDTSHIGFQSQNNHIVGLTGPLNPTASYDFGLPSTFNNLGQVLYQSDNGRGNNFNVRSWAFTSGGSTGQVLTYQSGSAPTWTTVLTGLPLPQGATNYIQVTSALQSGATFYVSSGTVAGPLNISGTGGGQLSLSTGTAPSGVAGQSLLYADGTTNLLSVNNNNGSASTVVASSVTMTAGVCAQISANGLIVPAPNGAACGTGGGTPANPSTSVQYNNSGSFGGSANFEYNGTTVTFQHTPIVISSDTFFQALTGPTTSTFVIYDSSGHPLVDLDTTSPGATDYAIAVSSSNTASDQSFEVNALGMARLLPTPMATLRALTPGTTGLFTYCSDCATTALCVSTGMAVNQWASATAKGTACN